MQIYRVCTLGVKLRKYQKLINNNLIKANVIEIKKTSNVSFGSLC